MSPLEGPSPGRLSAGGKSIKLCALCASVVHIWLRPKGRAVRFAGLRHGLILQALGKRRRSTCKLTAMIRQPAVKSHSKDPTPQGPALD